MYTLNIYNAFGHDVYIPKVGTKGPGNLCTIPKDELPEVLTKLSVINKVRVEEMDGIIHIVCYEGVR